MKTTRANILIIEDDRTFGKALEKALLREAYSATHVTRATDAMALLDKQKFDLLIIDGLIPGTSGVEVGMQARKKYDEKNEPLEIIFMSGIFVDKKFIKDTTTQLKCLEFFKKPFDIQKLIDLIDPRFKKTVTSTKHLIYELFNKPAPLETLNTSLNKLEEIHCYHLPLLLNLLLNNKFTGQIELTPKKTNETAKIIIQNGCLIDVSYPRCQYKIEDLLLKEQVIEQKVLDQFLQLKINPTTPLIEKLIGANLLSPHVANQINKKLVEIKLTELIKDKVVSVKLSAGERDNKEIFSINPDDYLIILQNLVFSLISSQWLKGFFNIWVKHILKKTDLYDSNHPIFNLIAIKHSLPELEKLWDMPLEQLYFGDNTNNTHIMRAIFMLLSIRMVYFEPTAESQPEFTDQLRWLTKLHEEMVNLNEFEIITLLGVSADSREWEIAEAYNEFKQIITPPENAADELQNIYQQIMGIGEKSNKFSSDSNAKSAYIESQKQKEYQNADICKRLLETVYADLQRLHGEKALETLHKIANLKADTPNITALTIWAKFATLQNSEPSQEFLNNMELSLLSVPIMERYQAIYFYINGLIAKHRNLLLLAKINFSKCIQLNQNLIAAKSELETILLIEKHNKLEEKCSFMHPPA